MPTVHTGIRKRKTKIRICHHRSLPHYWHGQATRFAKDRIDIDLNDEAVAGFATNQRESWLTLFHEIGHVVFGDCDRPSAQNEAGREAREHRAEAFAVFMIDVINRAVRMSVASRARASINKALSEGHGSEQALWCAFWAKAETPPTAEQAFARYRMPDGLQASLCGGAS